MKINSESDLSQFDFTIDNEDISPIDSLIEVMNIYIDFRRQKIKNLIAISKTLIILRRVGSDNMNVSDTWQLSCIRSEFYLARIELI